MKLLSQACTIALAVASVCGPTNVALAASPQIQVDIDARDAARRIVHVQETVRLTDVQRALVYPKWLPGEHAPSGPLNDVVNLRFSERGKTIPWTRDPFDMFTVRLELTPGPHEVSVAFDYATGTGGRGSLSPSSSSAQLAIVRGNQVVFYPQGTKAAEVTVVASIKWPPGWSFGTALKAKAAQGETTTFLATSLETFIDSPMLAGAFTKRWDLTPAGGPTHTLFAAADSAEALALKAQTLAGYRKLITETYALFGTRPYRQYTFLVALSDEVPHGGLEHHESSDNRMFEDTWVDEGKLLFRSSLLAHEMAHTWNGKLRRPRGLATSDYQQPYDTSLLWVYEGLTTYLGEVLAARAGLRTAAEARDLLAITAAGMDASAGRHWRPVTDVATSAQLVGTGGRNWRNARRGLDYYPEMYLVWLQADAVIRKATNNARSLDDFCKAFHGTSDGKPAVVPYDRADVVAALAAVAPYDWEGFFARTVDGVVPKVSERTLPPLGWKLTFKDESSKAYRAVEAASKETNLLFSIGLAITEDGTINDVLLGSAAANAGVSPAMRVLGVNGRRFTVARLRSAIADTPKVGAIELLLANDDFFLTKKIIWKKGHQYPVLERIEGVPDLLSPVLAPRLP